MARAKETADFILRKVPKPIEYSDLFVERRRPSEVLGKPKDNPIACRAEEEIKANFSKPNWRFSDEENFDDLKNRAFAVLDHLAQRPEDTILVVTHGFILRIIIACVLFGNDLKGEECERCIRSFHMENTGITVLGYDIDDEAVPGFGDKDKNAPWWLWVWNDHAHLGEVKN